jgi:TolB-like protein
VGAADRSCSVDARQLEAATEREAWAEVIDLYTGPFLDGFSLIGAPDFEEWLSNTRSHLARLARRAFRRTIEVGLEANDVPAALAAAVRWATLEPFDDEAQHAAITMLAYSGDRSAALKHFDSFRARLARELGAEPLKETADLAERIKEGATPEYRAPAVAEGRAPVDRPPGPLDRAAEPPSTTVDWRTLFDELRKRWVFHVGLAYLAFAVVVIEVTDALVQNQVVSGWVFRAALILLALGLPVVVLLAWAQERPRVPPAGPHVSRLWPAWAQRVRPGLVLVLLSVFAIALFAWQRIVSPETGVFEHMLARPEPPRIAVLYFEDRSADGSLGDLAQGLTEDLTEDLIDRLQEVNGLDVISPSGVRPYIGTAASPESVARALGAGLIVEGAIELIDNSVAATIRLIDSTSVQIARFPVERPRGEALELQDEIADLVAHGLRRRIGQITLAESRYPTASNAAWEIFTQAGRQHEYGRELLGERDFAAATFYLERADSLFARAQTLDDRWMAPTLARGWLVADRVQLILDRGGISAAEPLPEVAELTHSGLAYAERALQLIPNDARALELRGALSFVLAQWGARANQDSLLELAHADLTTAVQLDESLVRAWYVLGRMARLAGNQAQAMFYNRKGLEADIYAEESRDVLTELFHESMHREAYDEAAVWCERGRRLHPKYGTFQICRITLLGYTAFTPEAADSAWAQLAIVEATPELASSRLHLRFFVAAILARAGLADSARSVIARTRAEAPDYLQNDLAALEAYVLTALGEYERALDLIALALEREPQMRGFVAEHPWYKELRDHPRFRQLVGSLP